MIPKLSLTNNEGYTFTFQRHKNGCSIQIEDKFGLSLGKAAQICIDGIPKQKLRVIENAAWNRSEGIIVRTIKKIFTDLVKEAETTSRKRTYRVQLFKQHGQSIVAIGPYGLAGGGLYQAMGMITGAAKLSFGIYVTSISAVFPLLLPAGTGLIASGSGDMYYSYKTPENKMDADVFMAQSTINFAGGAAGGGFGALAAPVVAPLGAWGAPMAASAVGNVANNVASIATEALIANDSKVMKKLTPAKMFKSAAMGVVLNGAAKLATGAVEEGSKRILKQAFDQADDVVVDVLNITVSGVGGAAGNAATKVVENMLRDNAFVTAMYKTRIPVDDMEPGILYLHIRRGAVYYRVKNLHNRVEQVHITDKVLVGITPKDGNSLFNAFAHQQIWSGVKIDATASSVRRALISHLSKNWSSYQKYQETDESKKEYLKRMASEGQAGGRLELHALADRYGVHIQVTKNSRTMFYGDQDNFEFTLLLKDKFYHSLFTHAAVEDLDGIKNILKFKSRKPLNREQNELIRTIAGKYGHVTTKLLEGCEDAAVHGGMTGAVIGATNGTIARWKAAAEKRKAEEELNENDAKKIHLDDEEQPVEEGEEQPVEEEGDDVVVQVQLSPEEQRKLQCNFDQATVRHENTLILSQDKPIDMENKGNVIFDAAAEMKDKSTNDKIKFMELELNRLYGIPVGTGTESFEHAFIGHHPRKAIAKNIQRILLDWQSKGSGVAQANALLQQAAEDLQNGRVTTIQPQPRQTADIKEMVTISENYSKDVGHHRNPYVQMTNLAAQFAGSNDGELYNTVYFIYLDAYKAWLRQPSNKRPSQYGFLTSVTDQLINGTNTVDIEMPKQTFLQSGLNLIGWINAHTDTPITPGIGVQTNGSNLQVGPKDYPTLFTVISSGESQGVDGFQLPAHTTPGPAPHLTEYSPPSVGVKITNLSPTVPPKPPKPDKQPNFISTTGHNNYQPLISTTGHALIDTWQHGVKNTHTVPHGAGRFLSGMVDKLLAPIVAMDYYMEPTHQHESKNHRMVCTGAALVTDYGISLAAGASCSGATPAVGFAAAAAVSPLAAMAGQKVQDVCHRVLNGEKDGLILSGKKKITIK